MRYVRQIMKFMERWAHDDLGCHPPVCRTTSRSIGAVTANIATANTKKGAFRLAYLHLTLAHSKSKDQGHAHVDGRYLWNGDVWGKHCNGQQVRRVAYVLSIGIIIYIWPCPVVKVKVMHILNSNISKMLTDGENIAISIKYCLKLLAFDYHIFGFDIFPF